MPLRGNIMKSRSIYEGEAWLGDPPEIRESEIRQTLEADVVVVGAGLAGVAAAPAAGPPAPARSHHPGTHTANPKRFALFFQSFY